MPFNEMLRVRLEHTFFEAVHEGADAYRAALLDVFADDVEYHDPAHELRGARAVADMLCAFSASAEVRSIRVHTLVCSGTDAMWSWTVVMKPRWFPFVVELPGCAHARIVDGKIVRQREYYDPIGSAAGRSALTNTLYRKLIGGRSATRRLSRNSH